MNPTAYLMDVDTIKVEQIGVDSLYRWHVVLYDKDGHYLAGGYHKKKLDKAINSALNAHMKNTIHEGEKNAAIAAAAARLAPYGIKVVEDTDRSPW